ncbi:MAG TPA: S-adenosylmethionine decarboxylase [bacterium]
MPQVCERPLAAGSAGSVRAAKPAPFGFQLLLDLYGCKQGACDDLELCYRLLEELVRVLKVEAQSPPFIFRTDGSRYPDKAGLSGWIPLVESGIQLHTLTPKDFISIDVYSCRQFDPEPVQAFVRSFFSPKRIDAQFLERGLDYNR